MGNLAVVTAIHVVSPLTSIMGYKAQHVKLCEKNKANMLRDKNKYFSLRATDSFTHYSARVTPLNFLICRWGRGRIEEKRCYIFSLKYNVKR